MVKVYKQEVVQELETFYGELLTEITGYGAIKEHLSALAIRMWEGVQDKNEAIFKEISNYHWSHLGKSTAALAEAQLTEEDCKKAIANEYGFRRWTEVQHVDIPYNIAFERTVNAMLEGDFETLKKIISAKKELVNTKSLYGHNATLMHYAASNGVELWRQKVPVNLPEIVRYLIQQGANKKAKMKVYGGEFTAEELLPSSAHPREAGLVDELWAVLKL